MSQDPQGSAPGNRLCAILDCKFGEYIAGVDLDRVQREIEPGSDFLVGQPFGDEVEYFAFALAERLDPFRLGASRLR
jgi:hypothetical protein